MTAAIVATKLYFPLARRKLVRRPRLIERLGAGQSGPLTLISALPGSGKTTLLSEWRADVGRHAAAAWLSLDTSDNDPARFLAGLISAFGTVRQGLADSTAPLLQSHGDGSHEGRHVTVLSGLVADQASLFGVLNRIRDLGLKLISVTAIERPQEGSVQTIRNQEEDL